MAKKNRTYMEQSLQMS